MRGHYYGEDLAAIHAEGFTTLASAAAAELLPRLAPGSLVLDLGCGDGTTARLVSEAGHRVEGLDPSPAFIVLARARAPQATFRVGSLRDDPLPSDRDAALAIGEVLGYAGPTERRASGLGVCSAAWPAPCAPAACCSSTLPSPEGCPRQASGPGSRARDGP
jgi:SAM-dependent methyltransferase